MIDSHTKQIGIWVRLGAVSALVLGGCAASAAGTGSGADLGDEPATASAAAASTIADVDFAPECAGILTYVNGATFAELDSYLPSNVATGIVARRATAAFVDIADLSSVSGIAQARLSQIAERSRALGFIAAGCAGIYEELAVSADDRTAILAYANTASQDDLWNVARTEPDATAPALVAGRPYTTLQQLVDVVNVGPSTLRSLRDAAVIDPFDDLAGRVNGVHREASISTAFNWYSVASDQPGRQSGMLCFGVPADLVDSFGGEMRANLADGAEVLAEVTSTVNFADRNHEVGSATAGLAHLQAQVTGHQFLGCYIGFQPNPWCGVSRAFFVNKDTGYRVLTETFWCE
jgi:DNA uptake protein ComE-like DNA-binding protein